MEQTIEAKKPKTKQALLKEIKCYCFFSATGLFAGINMGGRISGMVLVIRLFILGYTLICLYMIYKRAKELAEI
jgi:hypothetical protein